MFFATSQYWMGLINFIKLTTVDCISSVLLNNTTTMEFFCKKNSEAEIQSWSSWVRKQLMLTNVLCFPPKHIKCLLGNCVSKIGQVIWLVHWLQRDNTKIVIGIPGCQTQALGKKREIYNFSLIFQFCCCLLVGAARSYRARNKQNHQI